jgi:hypothetical protein
VMVTTQILAVVAAEARSMSRERCDRSYENFILSILMVRGTTNSLIKSLRVFSMWFYLEPSW